MIDIEKIAQEVSEPLQQCFGAWKEINEHDAESLIKKIDDVCRDKNDFIKEFI